ncbi:adenosine deaminase [Frankia sp. CNm7]|uniref:Adenosine deaminase n=1 Tax=Frankia nepalensis TaxID=1836974 RepID=A0A937RRU3_9ACTN|nr:adenosine deaminase [Frankia nepalensis]MBL7500124.1 adenosine deaminase [Frankia nepalensis]MBL7511156.1 adenosine deaminase [Frankia nepalensis]MBL7517843.1 adenosine deaminase [Frankia nepalensis]MBL7631568.1 adenosine deaminase [Frankia nepalensis]
MTDTTETGPGALAGPVSDEQFVDALPKVELHVHLEGSMLPGTVLALARRHQVDDIPTTEAALREWYAFKDFNHFLEVYRTAVKVLRDEDDFALLARETALGLAAQNVRYAEIYFTPYIHAMRGVPIEDVFAGVERGRAEAYAATGIDIRWITDIPGGLPGADMRMVAERTVEYATTYGGTGVIGIGVGGAEVGVPRPQFAEAFAAARQAGLRSIPHAGETSGARTVWDSIEHLGADRIGHGIRSLDDPALIERLRTDRIPLDVSPTSNLRTGVVADYASHPLPTLIAEGVPVSLNSDDPPMFGTTLRDEYLHALRDLGLSRATVAELAAAAVHHSFLTPDRKEALLAEQRAAVAAALAAEG